MEDKKKNKIIERLYYEITDLWRVFCEKHTELFDLTCTEYDFLLRSEVENLDKLINNKEMIIGQIQELEDQRSEIIVLINKELKPNEKIEKISELIKFFHNYESKKEQYFLSKFNSILIDLIEKIQKQNKRNQLFLNKAITSLKEIRMSISGDKRYATYTPSGEEVRK